MSAFHFVIVFCQIQPYSHCRLMHEILVFMPVILWSNGGPKSCQKDQQMRKETEATFIDISILGFNVMYVGLTH